MDMIDFSFIASDVEKRHLIYFNKNIEDFFLEHQSNSISNVVSEYDKDGNVRYKWDFSIIDTIENKNILRYISECMPKEIKFSITPLIVIGNCFDTMDDFSDITDKEDMNIINFSFIASSSEKEKLTYSNKNIEDFFLEHQSNSISNVVSECDKDGNERYKWDFSIDNTNENKHILLHISECMPKEIKFLVIPPIVIDDCSDIIDKEYIHYPMSNNYYSVHKFWVKEHWRYRHGKYEHVNGYWRNRY